MASRGNGSIMPYKKYEPIEEKIMDKTRFEGHHSICQMLRDIYHMTEDQEIKIKCRIGMSMTKSMHRKLKKYKEQEARGQEIADLLDNMRPMEE